MPSDNAPSATIRLSVLDQSPIREGGTPRQAFEETLALARHVERLGYHRYWLAEHHASPGLAGAAPEVMVTRVAAETTRIRVGSGGVMLNHYSPYKVAEVFRTLEAMFPGRIDLGIGRAPGSDLPTSQALAYGSPVAGAEYFPRKVADLMGFVADRLPDDNPFAGLRALPETPGHPPIWMLGSSDYSAAYAAHFGLAFSFAQFITAQGGDTVLNVYRDSFKPSSALSAPHANLGVFVLCAETEEEAERLFASRRLWWARRDRGILGPVPSVEDALAYPYTELERIRIARHAERSIVGTPESVRSRLEEMAARYGVEEFVVLTICYDFAARMRSYELLADAFGLMPGCDA